MTSRERLLAALNCQQPDHTPCAFMMYKGLKNQCSDYRQFLEAQMAAVRRAIEDNDTLRKRSWPLRFLRNLPYA